MVYGHYHKNTEHFKTFTLPCFSMIATGDCSYESYCRFIHDHRLKCSCMKMFSQQNAQNAYQRRPKNYNAGERGFVVFYWPPSPDQPHIPHTHRKYELPLPSTQYHSKDYAYQCMASMWDHFLLFLQQSSQQSPEGDEGDLTLSAYQESNFVTGRSRLSVFRELSVRETRRSVQAKVCLPSPMGVADHSKSAFATPVAGKSLFENSSKVITPMPMPMLFPSPSYHNLITANDSVAVTETKAVMMEEEESFTTSDDEDDNEEDDGCEPGRDKHGRVIAVDRRRSLIMDKSPRSRGFAGYAGAVKASKNGNGTVITPPADLADELDDFLSQSAGLAASSSVSPRSS